ncbi:MAG: hypothetical protein OEZ37_12950, partial [Gemmatimonadota bacterium]|nr:hypothetical protein [Gemmatimonadota bacterium]
MARRRIAVVCGKTMTLGAAAVMVLAGPAAERASAQSFWTEASTLGYGGLAGATSMAFMCWHDCDSYR